MTKRTLTIVVEFDQDEKPDWIWASHMMKEKFHRVQVNTICEGDQIEELERLEDEIHLMKIGEI